MGASDLHARLQSFVGQASSAPVTAVDEVTLPAIRRWVEAMGDANPIYLDHDAAVAAGRPGIVAPPAMLGVWLGKGYQATRSEAQDQRSGVLKELADAGFTTTPGTNLRQEFTRELRLGDRVSRTSAIDSVSDEKQTALGPGHFVTMVSTVTDQNGEVVGRDMLRVIAFRPTQPLPADGATPAAPARTAPIPPRSEVWVGGEPDPERGPLRGRVALGTKLPSLHITLDRVAVAVCTTACNDFRGGHYDAALARAIGTRDIFTDIPTSTGLTARYITDWAGPASRLRSVDVRLGVPFFAGATLRLQGEVTAVADDGIVTVSVDGLTDDGAHIIASVDLLPAER